VCVLKQMFILEKYIIFKHFQTYAVFSLYVHDHNEVTV